MLSQELLCILLPTPCEDLVVRSHTRLQNESSSQQPGWLDHPETAGNWLIEAVDGLKDFQNRSNIFTVYVGDKDYVAKRFDPLTQTSSTPNNPGPEQLLAQLQQHPPKYATCAAGPVFQRWAP